MNIGIVVDNELNDDVRVLREIGILKDQDYEIFVLCFGFRKKYKNPVNKINITRINIHRKLRDFLFFLLNTIPVYEWIWALQIKKHISLNGIEILHVHDLYMARAAHSGIKRTGKNIPLILDLHENYPFTVTTYNWTKGFIRSRISQPGKWLRKEKEYLEYAERIIVLSNDFRNVLINRYPEFSEETFVVLPNVPDLSQPEPKSKGSVKNPFKQDFPILFYYGVIAERRGVFDALRVFINLVKEDYPVNFLLIGPVDKKDKTRFLDLIGLDLLTNRIHYIPWIDSTELSAYLEISDICIAPFHKNPQHESGVANKIYEYMLGKKPIIVSDCLPQKKLIEKYNCGLVFENMAEFQNAIIKLIDDSNLRTGMGEKGYEAVIKEHHTGMVKENLILLYKTITC
ncbi:MAG: glycosyltransferase family 4 protein [Bacteroidales bacterium]